MESNIQTVTGGENMTCPATGFQGVSVCVPVTVTPFALPGPTVTKCCGEPEVKSGNTTCAGKKNGTCTFTISQVLCVEVPVLFGANAELGDTFVNCLGADNKPCKECEGSESADTLTGAATA